MEDKLTFAIQGDLNSDSSEAADLAYFKRKNMGLNETEVRFNFSVKMYIRTIKPFHNSNPETT